MNIELEFLGISKDNTYSAGRTALSLAGAYTTYVAVPVVLGSTVGCLYRELISVLRQTKFNVGSYIASPYDSDVFVTALLEFVEAQEKADAISANKPLRGIYGNEVFACSQPTAWFKLKFSPAKISITWTDRVPTILE